MHRFILFVLLTLTAFHVQAGGVILMIADGMGDNHVHCADKERPVYLKHLPIHGFVKTRSASHEVTDSAASATAYACGKKTTNKYLAKLPDGTECLTLAEEAAQKGIPVGIYSTDYSTGATPSAFYAHTRDRNNKKKIETYKAQAASKMDIVVPVTRLSDEIGPRLQKLSANSSSFFVMFEEAGTDTNSHKNNLDQMKKSLYDFDLSVMEAVAFAHEHPDTTVIVLADHETGGLTPDCHYTTKSHTGVDISVYAYGRQADLFSGVQDNTEIYTKMRDLLFND